MAQEQALHSTRQALHNALCQVPLKRASNEELRGIGFIVDNPEDWTVMHLGHCCYMAGTVLVSVTVLVTATVIVAAAVAVTVTVAVQIEDRYLVK